MKRLAREIVGLKPNDPHRTEIVAELSRLSVISAALKNKGAD